MSRVIQRKLSRKEKDSNRHQVARRKVARLHLRVVDRRQAMLHEASQVLTRRLDTIVVRDLAMGNMSRNRRLSQEAMDSSWAAFRRRLDCKADLRGNTIFVARRLFASTKTCSRFGSETAHRQCDPGFRPCRSSGPPATGTPPPRGHGSFGLPLAAQADLEPGKDAKHVEECLAGGGRGVRRLLGCGDVGAPAPGASRL
ncbi:MAG: transposase [Boseongicola sp.]|nr:transposase [Boseongicola sp.]